MKNVIVLITLVSISAVMLVSFQCASPEMTSAKLYMQRSDWASAERSLLQEIEKNPNNAEAWYLLGRVRMEMMNYAGMKGAFDRSLEVGNQHAQEIGILKLSTWAQLYNSGVDAFNKAKLAEGDTATMFYNKAVERFTNGLILNPDSVATYISLGLAYLAVKEVEKGMLNLELALNKQHDPDLAFSIGGQYYERGRKAQAEAESATGARKDSLMHVAQQAFDKAIAVLDKGRQLSPDNAELMGLLLDTYLTAGRTEEATEKFREAVQTHPRNKVYRYDYGVLLIRAGDHPAAVEEFKAAIEIDPTFEDALYNLSVAYLQWGAKLRAEAEAKARAAGKNAPIDRSYEEKFQLGKASLETLRDLKPNDPDIWEALGQAYANLNMQKEAAAAFTKADELRKGQ